MIKNGWDDSLRGFADKCNSFVISLAKRIPGHGQFLHIFAASIPPDIQSWNLSLPIGSIATASFSG
jgi:hypothetical protein